MGRPVLVEILHRTKNGDDSQGGYRGTSSRSSPQRRLNQDNRDRALLWGAKSAGSPTLYRPESILGMSHHATSYHQGSPRALVTMSSPRALAGAIAAATRLVLGPTFGQGTRPSILPRRQGRSRRRTPPFHDPSLPRVDWEDVPTVSLRVGFDTANHGAVSRSSVISGAAGPSNLAICRSAPNPMPRPWGTIPRAKHRLHRRPKLRRLANAALLFQQPNREPPSGGTTPAGRTHRRHSKTASSGP